jgi:hypothetical protein
VLERCRLAFLSHRVPHGSVDGSGENTVDSGWGEVNSESSGNALVAEGGMVSACTFERVCGGRDAYFD